MGNGNSRASTAETSVETMESQEVEANSSSEATEEEFHDTIDSDPYIRARENEMIEFNKQLAYKREQRREVIAKHRAEKENLKKSLEDERRQRQAAFTENEALREILRQNNIDVPEAVEIKTKEDDDIISAVKQMQEDLEGLKENNRRLRLDLAESHMSLQTSNSDIINLNYEIVESRKQIKALKDVVSVSKTMINLREQQLNDLKEKLTLIEQSLADREANILSTDLKQEYERQLQNIRVLRGLYEERARLAEVTRLNLLRELEEQKRATLAEVKKCIDLTNKIEELEKNSDKLSETIENKNDQIKDSKEETRGLQAEMSTVNNLFSQVLLGYKSKHNWDQLIHRLEENHGILTHMVERDDGTESSSALPKLLLELVNQVDENDEGKHDEQTKTEDTANGENEDNTESQNASAEEIVKNLPKVWKVLMELLSHQNSNETSSPQEKVTTCYKTVETATGSVQVPSVSQTYIRLKDLIVEKLTLIKEVNRMKQLNTHLECRLGEQERRLCLVTSELGKTWHVVGRLRRHHHQLHTHEKILKYELQQKRKLLNELKEELMYCREKWEQAREKNTQTEKDWRKLRTEFSSRKKVASPSFNNSAESGYSDERQSDSSSSNDESECVNETPMRCKKKVKTFDNVVDSSADFNLAEREDPISDMLDVADLPLDSHELEDISERPGTSSANVETEDISMTESCNLKSDKNCDETEDEVGDSYSEECPGKETSEATKATKDVRTDLENVVLQNNDQETNITETDTNEPSSSLPKIDPAVILESIQKQTKMLDSKDKQFEALKQNSSELYKKMQNTLSKCEELTITLDDLLSRPGTSQFVTDENITNTSANENSKSHTKVILGNGLETIEENPDNQTDMTNDSETVILYNADENLADNNQSHDTTILNEAKLSTTDDNKTNNESIEDNKTKIVEIKNLQSQITNPLTSTSDSKPNAIVVEIDTDSVIQNNEIEHSLDQKNLASNNQSQITATAINNTANDIKTNDNITEQNVDNSINNHVDNNQSKITEPLSSASNINLDLTNNEIITKDNEAEQSVDNSIENLGNENPSQITESSTTKSDINLDTTDNTERDNETEQITEPSTSMDHEARLVARELRLKRLEEQTKSLVTKVNDTTTKAVKINYKLDELHNIYGSENSRAGTPSRDDDEDDEEKTKENE